MCVCTLPSVQFNISSCKCFRFLKMSDSETGGDAKRGRARAKKAAEPRSVCILIKLKFKISKF